MVDDRKENIIKAALRRKCRVQKRGGKPGLQGNLWLAKKREQFLISNDVTGAAREDVQRLGGGWRKW